VFAVRKRTLGPSADEAKVPPESQNRGACTVSRSQRLFFRSLLERGIGIITAIDTGEHLPVVSNDVLSRHSLVENDAVSFGGSLPKFTRG
jgi:hypothetical protein